MRKHITGFAFILALASCGSTTEQTSQAETPQVAAKEKFAVTNIDKFPGIEASNYTDEYDGFHGQYKASFQLKNSGKTSFDILQVSATFYNKDGAKVGEAITGAKLHKGEIATFPLQTLIPNKADKPERIEIAIDQEASFVSK